MGKLTNLNPSKPLTEADMPSGMATDAEVQTADAAHVNATDPHLQYPTQARGDARYVGNDQGLIIKVRRFTGITDPTIGDVNFPHGLVASKILEISALIAGFPPAYITGTFGGSGEYNCFFTANHFFIVCGPNKSSLIGKPYSILITYLA